MLVDSHCHLDFADFAEERGAIIERARAAGIGTMLTICTRLDEFPAVQAISEVDAVIWCAVGAHPHDAADHADLTADHFSALPSQPRVVRTSYTGLDLHYAYTPL